MTKQYGPDVWCPISERVEGWRIPVGTHRPGDSGLYFCMACGATDHEEV